MTNEYKLVEWSPALDLSDFYQQALRRGLTNNSSQHRLVDNFRNERSFNVWMLYYNNQAVGSVAAHSLDVIDNAYRICARTCVFSDLLPLKQLRSIKGIVEHQNITAQFYIPKCIEWAGNSNLYITSHKGDIGTQRLVHEIYCPALAKTGVLSLEQEIMYRGHVQSFWKLNVDEFLSQLNQYQRWI